MTRKLTNVKEQAIKNAEIFDSQKIKDIYVLAFMEGAKYSTEAISKALNNKRK